MTGNWLDFYDQNLIDFANLNIQLSIHYIAYEKRSSSHLQWTEREPLCHQIIHDKSQANRQVNK